MDYIKYNENELIEALQRSGYLLESEIAQYLYNNGFFVESNQVILDAKTGKNREIDLIAEYNSLRTNNYKCCAKIRFVFEIKNNTAPIVLMTEFRSSPYIEDYFGIKEKVTIPEDICYFSLDGYYNKIIKSDKFSKFTQYCSFQRKKGKNQELMALHPDNIYTGIEKITQYCEIDYEDMEQIEKKDGHFRHFINMPILLIKDNLFELTHSQNNEIKLKEVDSSILVYNYFNHENEPTMVYVFIVTHKGLPDFLEYMLKIQDKVQTEMVEKRRNKI